MIAVDAMGGDFAPHIAVKGALQAACKGVSVALFGSKELVSKELNALDAAWQQRSITLIEAPDTIGMDEEAVLSVRNKPTSSLVQAVASVKAGKTRAVVSAGNSGAFMAAATFILGRVPDVERPAIAGWLPTRNQYVLMLDLGANADVKASFLYQFAHIGAHHVTEVRGIKSPRVGLLSNGIEKGKGSAVVKEAFSMLESSALNFIGNIEPQDVLHGKADVIVCDGFAGNVFLKTFEGTVDFVKDVLRERGERNALTNIQEVFFSQSNGGALLLGVQGVVVVCHGASVANDIEHAIMFADRVIQSQSK